MRASYDLRADLTLLTTNKMSGGQQLFGSNNLVIAGHRAGVFYRGEFADKKALRTSGGWCVQCDG